MSANPLTREALLRVANEAVRQEAGCDCPYCNAQRAVDAVLSALEQGLRIRADDAFAAIEHPDLGNLVHGTRLADAAWIASLRQPTKG